jgi:hypothetical protein
MGMGSIRWVGWVEYHDAGGDHGARLYISMYVWMGLMAA